MSAQMNYSFSTPIGQAGGIYDLAPYAVESFRNEAANGVMKFGMGVVRGTNTGVDVNLPAAGATAAAFEGVVTNRRTSENALLGGVELRNGITLGVMRWGRIYGLLATGVDPAYGDKAYLVVSGADAGCFTNVATGALDVKAEFRGKASDGIALVEIFNDARA